MSKKFLAGGMLALLLASPFAFAVPVHGDTNASIAYLKSKPLAPWTIMALVAAGESPALDTLKTVTSEKAIDYEAPMLALTAAGKDPRNFGAADLVAKLKSFSDGTQLGDATILNDDVFGVLALTSAGEAKDSAVVSSTLRFIKNHQNGDGGWSYAVGGTSDTNTTAAAIMTFVAAGTPANDTAVTKAIDYLKAAQNSDGGFPYDPKSQWGTDSDASSDAWVIMALKSAGQDAASLQKDGKTPLTNLATFADPSGFYRYQKGASEDSFSPTTTSYAVIALAGKFLPVRTITPSAPVPVHYSYRIEGKTQELCAGESDGVTALDSVRTAADACGITYHIQESSIGSYVDEIATEKAAGASGWMYTVQNEPPSVGAGDYKLTANDAIVWYYGAYGNELLRLTLNATSTAAGAPVSGKVETYHAHAWVPFEGAAVRGANASTTTDAAGAFSLTLPQGIYALVAESPAHVRSNTEKAMVGTPDTTAIPLSVTITTSTSDTSGGSGGGGSGGGGGGGTGGVTQGVSITVETGTSENGLDFGAPNRDSAQKKTITLKNRGQKKLTMQAAVSGDDVFRSYLFLDGKTWRVFHTAVEPGGTVAPETSLRIPSSYPAPGAKKGSLVFWAVPVD